jgi:mannitol/fructose-specific phosphotransferase system IIA component (Ntr-type)
VLTLADYTSPELILPQLQSRNTPAVLAELCHTLERSGRVEDPLSFYNAVVSHEQLSSTAMAPGWALPHARLKSLSSLCFALGRSETPLAWNPAGGPEVRLVFLFAVPEIEGANYIMLLSALAKLSQNALRWQALLHAPDSNALLALLQNIPLRRPHSTTVVKRRFQAATL